MRDILEEQKKKVCVGHGQHLPNAVHLIRMINANERTRLEQYPKPFIRLLKSVSCKQ